MATPRMSIVVPSYQRRDKLDALLDSIATAAGPADTGPADAEPAPVELLVVLDGSTDGSREHLEQRARSFPVPLKVLWQANAGAGAARNRGVAAAAAPLLWLLDDDGIVSPQALHRHLDFDRGTTPVLMGPCVVRSSSVVDDGAARWYEARHTRLAAAGVVEDPAEIAFANASVPTQLLRDHPFDERFRGYGMEDVELAVRLVDAGVAVAFDPDAAIVHDFTQSSGERLRKLRQEGANRVRFTQLYPSSRHAVFDATPGRSERLLRRVAVPIAATPLWVTAELLALASRLPIGVRRQGRLYRLAESCALYSGVAGVPDGGEVLRGSAPS